MKRSTIVATVAAVAVVGGAAVASASLTSTGGGSATAQELQAAADAKKAESPGGADGTDGDAEGSGPAPAGGGQQGQSDAAATEHTGVAAEVIATALRAAPGYVIEVDLDYDDRHWEVEIAGDDGREHELDISLNGAKVVDHEREREDDIRAKHQLVSDAEVRAEDAARIAEERLGGHVTDIDLDYDDRVWEVEVRDADGVEWELDVDLKTGEIQDLERDD